MIQIMTLMMTASNAIMFSQINHPLAMGLTLLVQTLLVCLMTGSLTKTFWFSYILFLIFIGGMLVLFIYVTSLASNEMFSLSSKMIIMTTTLLSTTMILWLISDKLSLYTHMMNNEMTPINNSKSYMPENSLSLIKLYNSPTNMVTLLMISYLLITLIAIVKITNLFYGPLRPLQ